MEKKRTVYVQILQKVIAMFVIAAVVAAGHVKLGDKDFVCKHQQVIKTIYWLSECYTSITLLNPF